MTPRPRGHMQYCNRSKDTYLSEASIRLACDGYHVDQLTPAERGETIYRLTRAGLTGRQIAEQLRISMRTVARRRSQRRQETAA